MHEAIWTGMYAELPLIEAIRTLAAHGWRAFETSTEHLVAIETATDADSLIEEVNRAIADSGLAMPQAHAYLQANVAADDPEARSADVARLARHIEIAWRLGVGVVVIHSGGPANVETREEREESLRRNVDAFKRLGDLAGEHTMRIGLENLMRRNARTACEMLDLVDRIGHPAIGITLDTSHANVVGLDIPKMIREIAPLLVATHLSDNDGSSDQHRTPGGGRIEWVPVAAALRRAGYSGLWNLEIPGERHANLGLRELESRHALAVAKWLAGST